MVSIATGLNKLLINHWVECTDLVVNKLDTVVDTEESESDSDVEDKAEARANLRRSARIAGLPPVWNNNHVTN